MGLFATVVSGAFMWVPSVWYDEAATVVAATRSWSELWDTVQTVDAVHMAWYAVMHLWFDLVGYSPFTLRAPSALCVGATAALLVVLARRYMPRRAAIAAGLFYAVLPRTTFVGAEGRTFALSALLAVLLTLLLLAAVDRSLRNPSGRRGPHPAAWWWAGYTVLTVISTAFFLYLALLVVAHVVTVAVLLRGRPLQAPSTARIAVGFTVAATAGAIGTAPVALMSADQSGQVGWIDPPSWDTVHHFLISQWSPGNPLFAWLLWGLVVAGLIVVWRQRRRHRMLSALLLPWLLVPSFALLALSWLGDPLWSPRYQTFSAPALALLMALGTTMIPWRRGVAALLVMAAILSVPSWSDQREPTAKDGAAWDQVAQLLDEERTEADSPLEEGIVYGPVRRHPGATSRIISYTYPDAFDGMEDFTLQTAAPQTGGLWEDQYELEDVVGEVDDLDVVWLVTSDRQDWRPHVTELLDERGFSLEDEWNLPRSNVLKFSR